VGVRVLLIGDIVGRPGRQIVERALPMLRRREQLDLVTANAENAAGGSGLTPAIYTQLRQAGVDVITLGDHAYRRREILPLLEQADRIVRPANYPPEAPGRSWTVVETAEGIPVAIFTLLGRVFMPPVDCPLRAADQVLAELPPQVRVILVDIHAEATSDKQLLARYLDGRVSAVLGTHTHVPTADETILPGGTAFQCDVGMTGPHKSIIGRRIDRVLETVRTQRPTHFEVASEDVRLQGTIVEVDPASGRATAIRPLRLSEADLPPSVAPLAAKPEATDSERENA
jgi:metallophosphoesterase (TIGR00282 family)